MSSSEPAQGTGGKARMLAVDDFPSVLAMLKVFIQKADFEVVTARDGIEALEKVKTEGPHSFAGVFTDQQMPQMTGLELLEKLHELDPTLSTVILTADEERGLIATALRGGAVDFITKPIDGQVVMRTAAATAQETARRRSLRDASTRLQEVSTLQSRLTPRLKITSYADNGAQTRLVTRNYPINEAGGDFVNISSPEAGIFLLSMGDVSGHGLKEGFLAAYFQGLIQGMTDEGVPLATITNRINQFLLNNWGGDTPLEVQVSLSVILVAIDCLERRAKIAMCGGPPPRFGLDGKVHIAPKNGTPLGWFGEVKTPLLNLPLTSAGCCYLWSDGLEEHAYHERVDPLALAHRIAAEPDGTLHRTLLANRKDDIVVCRLEWCTGCATPAPIWLPLFSDRYAGNRAAEIDSFQAHWRNSLRIALPSLANEPLNSILLCCREAVLNGLNHGCQGIPSKACRIDIAVNPDQSRLQAIIGDEGAGFPADAGRNDEEHISLGLKVLRSLADEVVHTKNGAEVTLRFPLHCPGITAQNPAIA